MSNINIDIETIKSLGQVDDRERKLKAYKYGDTTITIKRMPNDINGNARYQISFYDDQGKNITEKFKERGRYYSNKGMISFKSCSLSTTLKSWFDSVELNK